MQLLKNICARGAGIAPGTRQGLEQSAEYLSPLLKGETKAQREKIQKLIPAVLQFFRASCVTDSASSIPWNAGITGGAGSVEYGN